jgi:hypothetical protein
MISYCKLVPGDLLAKIIELLDSNEHDHYSQNFLICDAVAWHLEDPEAMTHYFFRESTIKETL